MTDDEKGFTVRDGIERSALTKADSLNHTFNQHFLAANTYRWLNRFLDTVLFAASVVLVSQVFWTVWPGWTVYAVPIDVTKYSFILEGTLPVSLLPEDEVGEFI